MAVPEPDFSPPEDRADGCPDTELATAMDTLEAVSDAVEAVTECVARSVVGIRIERPGPVSAPGFSNRTTVGSVGSGVIISAGGLIVTAAHVVSRAVKITVTTPDGAQAEAVVAGRNDADDLALIKIDAKGLVPIEISESAVAPGRFILSVGRPPESGHVVSTGIVSTPGRSTRNSYGDLIEGLIQTTAVVEPGVSGGAMTDGRGRLIGIVISATDSTRAISFAAPAHKIRSVARSTAPAAAVIESPSGSAGIGAP